ncbi:FAD-dependent oxidoreductase [Suttonella sp. R2A3]|uniref:FAD-dependent oxidoreductase n=1 Tax=Suttonella sp. R2A3 TaxID=2908648 RepID=UPI0038FC289F
MSTYTYPEFAYRCSEEQQSGVAQRHDVAIIGAGPIGLTAALDCAARGIKCVIFDDNNTVSVGSRAVCYAKRALEIWQRLGVAEPMLKQGVKWKIGKTFFHEELAYQFDLLPESGHELPAMINLQQYYLEEYLVEACDKHPLIDLRWKHRVEDLEQHDNHVVLTVKTPDGSFSSEAQWVIACDGASSSIRRKVGADFEGRVFDDQFLIADIVMHGDYPSERWFWFDPPFHPGQSVLLHRQSDNIWRIDFQLGNEADAEEWKKPENVLPLLKKMLGDREFALEWVSVYRFACRRIGEFRHQRVLFAGDAAHQVSPFGARGANTGVADVDNLIWKLKLVLDGKAPERLLDSYMAERHYAADENIQHSSRATDFITPKSQASQILRDSVLELAKTYEFARPLVNSGRLSTATNYHESPLNSPDTIGFRARCAPGAFCPDAPIRVNGKPSFLLRHLGKGFVLLADQSSNVEDLDVDGIPVKALVIGRDIEDSDGVIADRYSMKPGSVYLIRPDQHIAARWKKYNREAVIDAVHRATAHT